MTDFPRFVTVSIFNVSGAAVSVNYGILTGGAWQTPPQPGTIISPTKNQDYVNGVTDTLTAMGGQILLSPAGGGTITLTWSFPASGPLTGTASNTASSLAVVTQLANTQTETPTMQVIITNASNTAALMTAAK